MTMELSHQAACARIAKYRGKYIGPAVANNTRIHLVYDLDTGLRSVVVRLHDTNVVTIGWTGYCKLNTGGWRTVATKDRINRFSPARVYSINRIWYVAEKTPFFDGIVVDPFGEPTTKPDFSIVKRQLKRKKLIDNYCAKVRKLDTLPVPSQGDCWGCLFCSDDRTSVLDMSCVVQHVKEGYVHGSLLLRALRWAGWTPYAIDAALSTMGYYGRERVIRTLRKFLHHVYEHEEGY